MPDKPKRRIVGYDRFGEPRYEYVPGTADEVASGIGEGLWNTAKGLVMFPINLLQGIGSYTLEELRDPETRKALESQGVDVDAEIHRALRRRGRGEPLGPIETIRDAAQGMATMGYNAQRAMQGGGLWEWNNGHPRLVDNEVAPREIARNATEQVANAMLLRAGRKAEVRAGARARARARLASERAVPDPNLPKEGLDRPTYERRRAAQAERDAERAARQAGPAREAHTPVDVMGLLRRLDQARAAEAPAFTPRAPFLPEGAPSILGGTGNTLQDVRTMFRRSMGGDEGLPRIDKVDEGAATQMAEAYENLKSDPTNPDVVRAYRAFNDETMAQAEALRNAGYSWEFVDYDPYPPSKGGSKAMLRDLRENHHIKVYKTQGDQTHPLMTNEQNNLFRAVHEIVGHGVDEVSFNARGEENAFRSHAQMYSPEARRVMATETRGQNSWFNYGPHKDVPAPTRPFSEQKAALWPEALMGDYPSIVPERIKMPSVQGADGNYYTGANHALASEAAGEALRATPEGRAAIERNRGNATIRGSEGFQTTRGRQITREEARTMAGATGQAPRLASQYTQLHSSDLMNPFNHAQEFPVPTDLLSAARVNDRPVGLLRSLFDPSEGVPNIAPMEKLHGRPESGFALNYAEPGSILRVPQSEILGGTEGLPTPLKRGEWRRRYDIARHVLDNPLFAEDVRRGADLGFDYWYNTDPIYREFISRLGTDAGSAAFNELMGFMGPTSIQTPPVPNLRNAGYQYFRTANPTSPMYSPGFSPLYPTQVGKMLRLLEQNGGVLPIENAPKAQPYAFALGGDWARHVLDIHGKRAAIDYGLPLNGSYKSPDMGVFWDPYSQAFAEKAAEFADQGLVRVPSGRDPTAAVQAAQWGGAGPRTGVFGLNRARPEFWQIFEDAVGRTAQHTGVAPNDILDLFVHKKIPLF